MRASKTNNMTCPEMSSEVSTRVSVTLRAGVMADRGTKDPLSLSPNEGYNPLADDFLPGDYEGHGHDADRSESSEDNDCDSQFNSVEEPFNTALYSITPPVNQRGIKREKKKQQSYTQKVYSQKQLNELRMAKREKQKKGSPVSVIKERYAYDPLFCKLSSVDSDDNFERDFSDADKEKKSLDNRESKKKSFKKTIAHERMVKRNSGDLTSIDTNTADVPLPLNPVKVDTSGRFTSLSLSARSPSLGFKISPHSSLSSSFTAGSGSGRSELRRQSVKNPDIPKDRVDFHKIFSTLINMGSHSKKEKDTKKEKEKMMNTYKRQMSSEQELLQERFKDIFWLELQMEQTGFHSFPEMEEHMRTQKEKIPDILDEILNFKFEFTSTCDTNNGCVNLGTDLSSISEGFDSSAYESENQFNSITLTNETIDRQREALGQVSRLLAKLDNCEKLFQSSKAFAKEYPLYKEKEFDQRLKTLYLWRNITNDLCHKMKILGRILGVQNMPDVDWPMIDLESPRQTEDQPSNESCYFPSYSIPEIQEPSEEELCDASNDEDLAYSGENSPEVEGTKHSPGSAKRVKFSIDSARSSRNTSRDNSPVSETYETSTPLKVPKKSSSSSGNLSRASSEASLDDFNKTSVYRKYVDKTLKRMGMNKLLMRFKDLLERSLQRAREALEKPKMMSSNSQSGGVTSPQPDCSILSSSPALDLNLTEIGTSVPTFHKSTSLSDFGTWAAQFIEMGLPSFRPSYLFLLHVFLDVIHEALRLRLEQRPATEPSYLSIRPLLKECKDVLRGSVIVKQYYQTMVDAVTSENEWRSHEEKYAHDLEQFDDDMRAMLEIYFTYLQNWLLTLQNLPEASQSLKNILELEWKFTKQICPHVIGGEAEAGKRFSTLASSLLNSISDFLENGIDDFTTSLYNWTMQDEEGEEEEEEGSLEEEPEEQGDKDLLDDERDMEEYQQRKHRAQELRHSFQQTSRNCKKLFNEARERASKALGFAKTLRKDLEIASDFNIAVTTIELLAQLKTTNHVMVYASSDPGYLMFIPQHIRDNRYMILQLLNVTCGREDVSLLNEPGPKDEGYLLMVRCGGGVDHNPECPLWFGESVRVDPTAETAIALSHIVVEGLLLVVINSSHLTNQRKQFEIVMGKTVELVNEQTSCHQAIAESLTELKAAALDLQEKVVKAIKQVDEKFYCDDIEKMDELERPHLLNLYRETMLKGYNLGFEYLREVTRLVTGEPRQQLSKRLVEFAQDWMKFVTDKCEKGRGMRPKWAGQGFDFLIVAFEPKNVGYLTDEEYQELKKCINNCISHVIGSADARPTPVSPTHGMPRSSSVDSMRQPYLRYPSWPNENTPGKYSRSSSNMSSKSAQSDSPTTPGVLPPDSRQKRYSIDAPHHSHSEVDIHDGEDGGIILDIHTRRRSRAGSGDMSGMVSMHARPAERKKKILELERKRDIMLQDHRVVGHVTSHKTTPDYRINARRVNFRWQRGIKIGEGQFGKVYSAVNVDTGELMAMKEMKFQVNDHQALKEMADEIIMFENIHHKNLVKYYGVEVHRDEMLVFMEFCDRGTLEEAARMGLPEHNIRIYTWEILLAINHLHENNIIHRDIKGANIFLTSSGTLKLGDFGCSAKLKNHATMPGEFNKIVGTMAYMAPEVITKNTREGHGRAADIWSLGCVVIELSTGKRPWHELENNAQIMFKVGMGGRPPTPEHLSEEGKDFMEHCFEFDSSLRWTASQLMDHSFVKVEEELAENEP
ncbi:hypothetical protein FSP39_015240 [Pinctada imbricata]|uniref:Mitogen-activated protein kinase kinase kinase 4 n=1 Tax=Pinctada imbricata TaxID=66713 RepID=A0AA88Y5G6_PINIB|nr:hypothetical protein FSP39_015240 [Pinctada imbricata]